MKNIKRIPAVIWPTLLVALGFGAAIYGVFGLLGQDAALVVGGVVLVAAGLLVDV